MVNPIDKVIARKTAVEKVNKEIRRRRNISKKTKGKTRKRKKKNKGKKRKKKKITTTQVAQPPIKLSDKDAKALLQVNITAKERRKKRKKGKGFAEKRAEEIAKTGIADASVLKQAEKTGNINQASLDASILKAQQQIASEVLGYTTQSKDPLTLRAGLRRYNQDGGVGGFGNVSSRYYSPEDDRGLRTGLQSEAIKSRATQTELERQASSRRRRQPSFRGGSGGDDDDDDRPRPPSRYSSSSSSLQDIKPPPPSPSPQTKRTPKPQPEPEPEPQRRPTPKTKEIGTSPLPAPIPRRTPPESYFAGRLAPDTPLRFRPLSQPIPPATPLPDVDEEIVEITGGLPASPIITGLQPAGTPELPEFPDAPTTPAGALTDSELLDDERFATPTLTTSQAILPPEEPLPAPISTRVLGPSVRIPEAGELRRPGSALASSPPDAPTGGAFRRITPKPEPEPEPEVIQSVRRGRGRPKGSKNKPRTATPFVKEETGQAIDRAELKFEMLRIQNILKRRLGSWKAKEVDDVQSLQELNEAVASFTDDSETAELIRLYWQIRLQLGFLKKL